MLAIESAFAWIAIVLYALSFASFVPGTMFAKRSLGNLAVWIAGAGLVAHGVAIGTRWIRTGHGPYLGFFEVASLLAFITVAMFLLLVWRATGFQAAGIAVMLIASFVMGGSLLVSSESAPVSGALASLWLIIHVLFANLAYACYVAGFVLSLAFLIRDHPRASLRLESYLSRLPDNAALDSLVFRFVGAGFVFQGAMIASGAIWANQAWGRYWGWDPIETWSLVAWGIYALYLHLRLTLGWSGRRAAIVAVVALPVIVFSLLGVPLVYDSIHGAYLYT